LTSDASDVGDNKIATQHSIEITPELRAEVERGMPII